MNISAKTVQQAGTFDRYTDAIILPGIIRICEDAFKACSSLVHVQLPNTVRYIESEAFGVCSSLTSVVTEPR